MPAHLADPDHNRSFTRGLFLGELREDLLHPFPAPEGEELESLTAILDSFRAFAKEKIDTAKQDHDGKFPDDVRAGMAELGLMGLNIPEAYGGFGASAIVTNRVFGEIGATDPALAVYFGAHESIGCKGINLFGTEDQKQRWLTKCATGERIAAFCLTEAGSGSDAQAMRTNAVLSADSTHYVLNGQKIWISNAGYAGVFTVFAKVPTVIDGKPKERVTAFIVDAHAAGVSLGKIEQKMGIKASDTRSVSFDNVRVPIEDRLGDVGHGFKIALEVLNSGRLGLAAASTRGAQHILEIALAYAKQREQFGRSIGSFEMIQRKFASLAVDVYASDAAWMVTAGMVDRGGIDFSLETAACKVFASELVFRATNEALQIAGGIGYSKEFPYEQAMRDARINLIFEGTNEIQRALIALSGLQQPGEQLKAIGQAFKKPLQSIGAIGSFLGGEVKKRLSKQEFAQIHPIFAAEAAMIAENVHDLSLAVERALFRHGKDIIERQFDQERMANAAIDIFMASATLVRATWAINKAGSPEKAEADVDHAKLFVPAAARRARRAVRAMDRNQDARLKGIAERALASGVLTVRVPTDG
ncbi:MAG: acyl-CoA dehydrogenase family protein [Gemmatimonadetes bacterium]|nr:acyl-CoA dehydrogenase family protein [Gemmatimonadota bacterium]